ncbi:unnamed protein product [Cunninghamella blakesleeana]
MSDHDSNINSPTDRSKRPRFEEEIDSDNEQHNLDDRHAKRQAVPDPETKAPHFAGEEKKEQTNKRRHKKWAEDDDQGDSDDDDSYTYNDYPREPITQLENDPSINGINNDDDHDISNNNDYHTDTKSATINNNTNHNVENQHTTNNTSNDQQLSICLRSIVSTKDAGVIIGRGGKNVNEIREYSSARVTISDIVQGAYERILSVNGSLESVSKAYFMVAEKILAEITDENNKNEKTITLQVLVPDSRVGNIIGRSGSIIKSIQENSRARVTVGEETLPMSTERAMTIIGVPSSIQLVIIRIGEILSEHPERNTINHIPYRPIPANTPIMQINRNYPTHHRMPAPNTNNAAGAGGGYAMIQGIPTTAMQAVPMGTPFFYQNVNVGYNGMPPATAASNGAAEYGNMPMNSSQAHQQIFIPNDMVGCIIGKGGSKINEIRQLSGSHIKIADAHGNTNERLVTISGTPESNQMALYMLYSRLEVEKNRLGII